MEKTNKRFTPTLNSNVKKEMVHPGVYILGGMGNITVIETDIGFVLIDAGRTPEMAEALRNEIRSISDAPIHSIVYSHGHNGYNRAAWYFREAAKADGEPEPRFVAHEKVSLRYRRYEETWQFQNYLNSN
ncbi:MAG: MBL fold metallo-hydrolase [Deltaproteobacteria bacterium]|nr:MBL fold metallo-hydrolase [Deltaproteobacteria bacterium]